MANAPSSAPEGDSGTSEFLLGVFPLALLLGAVLALAHGWISHVGQIASGTPAEVAGYRTLALVEAWPALLLEGVIAGLVAALALTYTVGRGTGALPALGAVAVALIATGAFLSGLPAGPGTAPGGAPPGFRPTTIVATVGAVALAFGLVRARFRGPIALAVGVVAAVGVVFAATSLGRRVEPGMPVSEVVLDLVATPSALSTITSPAGVEPRPATLSPAVDTQTDTGDKPALVLPPPSIQEFVVPIEGDGTRLMAAAGANLSVVRHYPEGLSVVYRVRVDGEVAWETTIDHRPEQSNGPGHFDASGLAWRHAEVDGERGIPVSMGQVVRFETDFAPGVDPSAFDPKELLLGFGGASLVREGRLPRAIASPEMPNVVFIVMDTQRLDRLGCYGYERPTSPNIDALAERGLVFEDAYTTSSWTWPSTASLMTGLSPDAHGVRGMTECTLSQRFVTLAEALQRRGYTTAAFSGNPIVDRSRAFDQGFERFQVEPGSRFVKSDELMPMALQWLEEHAALRFFLYLQPVDPHTPHSPHPEEARRLGLGAPPADWPEGGLNRVPYDRPPSPELRQYVDDLYDASVATGDRWVGELLARIDELGLTDRTIICFTSDHGEELFDHGTHGHGHDVWAELVRAPLILAGPGIPRRERRGGAVSNRFLPTTIAAMVGADLRLPELTDSATHLIDDPTPGEAWFGTSKGAWGALRYQTIYGLRRGALTTHWHHRDVPPKDVADLDLRIFDVLSRSEETDNLVAVRGAEAREAAARIAQLRSDALEMRPPLVLGAGLTGQNTLEVIGYVDKGAGATNDR